MSEGLEIRPGLCVIAVPTIWKIEGLDAAASPDTVCGVIAKETYGEHAKLYEPPNMLEGAEVYHDAMAAVERGCKMGGRSFEVVDPWEHIVRIGNEGGGTQMAGLRWVRVVVRDSRIGDEGDDG